VACGDEQDPRSGIQLDRSIGGVSLGMTDGQVRETLGAPEVKRPSELHAGWTQWVYRHAGIRVTLDESDSVWDVRTVSGEYRTPSEVGVGSSEEQLRQAL
jgi:hypothetical protein